jgi:hypothetical protein
VGHGWYSWWSWGLVEEWAGKVIIEVLTKEVGIADVR